MTNIIAEIGCNHKGDIEIAHQMIKIAKNFCGCKYVKFQKRNNKELLTEEEYNAPHPNPSNSYGNTYGEHREALEFTLEQHKQLKKWCEEEGIIYTTSVWDLTSAKEIISLNPQLIKIPSAVNTNKELLEYICKKYDGEVHLSFGMTTIEEEKEIIELFKEHNKNKNLVIYSCVSGYPVPFENICLHDISRLFASYGDEVKTIGFSGHHLGIAVDIAAITLGANWVERHFTLDRTWKGTDHSASLEPDGLRKLIRDVNNVSKSLTYKPSEMMEIELTQRKKLKWK